MFIDETIDLPDYLPERLQSDFLELRNIMMRTTGSTLTFFLRELRQPSKDIIWLEKSAGRI